MTYWWKEVKDDTPAWAYDEDYYCVCCGHGRWRFHAVDCELRDALDVVKRRNEYLKAYKELVETCKEDDEDS